MVDRGRLGGVLRRGRVSIVCALLVLGGVSLFRHDVSTAPASSRTGPVASTSLMARLPLAFEPNVGQVAQPVRFLARGRGYGLYLTQAEAVLALPAWRDAKSGTTPSVRMQFAGANRSAALAGTQQLPGHSNYFIGNDPSRWLHDVSHFSRVRYSSLYSGIDLDFYGREGRLEYDFEVAPGADPRQIELQFRGTDDLQVAGNGDLVLSVAGRELRFQAPHVYQKSGNREDEVAGSFIVTANGRVAFQIGDYDRSRTLVIDPVLAFSTYLGGSGDESCGAITGSQFVPHCPAVAVDSASRVYVAGATTSAAGWPTPGSATTFPPLGGASDVFVARVINTGSSISLDYLTFIGGTGMDYPTGVGVDSGFNVYVAGNTSSSDFPTINGLQASASGNHAFLAKLDPTGSANLYSTYLAGAGTDRVSDMTVDNQAHVYVFGITTSTDFPSPSGATPGALQGQYKTGALNQFFFTKLDPAQSGVNSLLYSTFLGGSSPNGSVVGGAIAVDSNLNVYLAGGTDFTDMPVVNAFQGTLKQTTPPTTDAWVAKLKAPATNTQQYSLIYETYLGGSGDDVAYGVATDGTNTFVTGSTNSSDIPIPTGTTAFQKCLDDPTNPTTCATGATAKDAFVAKFGVPVTTGTTQGSVPLNYFTYLGGSGDEVGLAITADSTQAARLTGFTQSGSSFLNTDPLPGVGGGTDAFFARIATTAGISSSTSILGGSGADIGTSLATDVTLNNYVAGETKSGDFPTAASPKQPPITPIQASLSGASDAFVSKLGSSTTGLSLTCPKGAIINGVTITACNPSGASVAPPTIGVGNQVTFTYPVYNIGDPITGAVFTSTVQGTNSSLPSNAAGTGCTNTGTSAVCNLGIVNTSSVTTSGSTVTLSSSTKVSVNVTATAPTPPMTATQNIGNGGVLNIAGTTFQSTTSLTAFVNDFTVLATPASQTVTAGNQATYTITVTPTGPIPESVSLGSCSGLPAGANCTFSNNPIANLNSGAQNRTLDITTTPRVTTPASLFRSGKILYAFWFPVSGLALIGAGATRRRRWLAGLFIVCTVAGMVLQAGCGSSGGNSSSTTGTPAGTYTVTMNATSGSATRSTAVTLVVK